MTVRTTPSAAELAAAVAAAPPADATQQHVLDEVQHPDLADAFEAIALRWTPTEADPAA